MKRKRPTGPAHENFEDTAKNLLRNAKPGQEPGLEAIGILLELIRLAYVDGNPVQPHAERLLAQILEAGKHFGSEVPTVKDLQSRFGGLAACVQELWPVIRQLSESFSRFGSGVQSEQEEESHWQELGAVSALTKPGKHGQEILFGLAEEYMGPRATSHGLDSASLSISTVEKIASRRQSTKGYKSKGSLRNALAYVDRMIRTKAYDALTAEIADGKVEKSNRLSRLPNESDRDSRDYTEKSLGIYSLPSGTRRRWKMIHKRLKADPEARETELFQLLDQLFGDDFQISPREQMAIIERLRTIFDSRMRHKRE